MAYPPSGSEHSIDAAREHKMGIKWATVTSGVVTTRASFPVMLMFDLHLVHEFTSIAQAYRTETPRAEGGKKKGIPHASTCPNQYVPAAFSPASNGALRAQVANNRCPAERNCDCSLIPIVTSQKLL